MSFSSASVSRAMMKLVSVNVGYLCEVNWNGETVRTGIYKEPVPHRVRIGKLSVEGDHQADTVVHGGPNKAVYTYPTEHYPFWADEFPGVRMSWGMFGENLSTQGLKEDHVHIGDHIRVGSAVLLVTQPRVPCYKLGIKFGRNDMVRRFLNSRRSGFYSAVLEEGELEAGDTIEVLHRDKHNVSVADINRLYLGEDDDPELLHRAVAVEALAPGWRNRFRRRLAKLAPSRTGGGT